MPFESPEVQNPGSTKLNSEQILARCVIFSKLPNISELQFLHL